MSDKSRLCVWYSLVSYGDAASFAHTWPVIAYRGLSPEYIAKERTKNQQPIRSGALSFWRCLPVEARLECILKEALVRSWCKVLMWGLDERCCKQCAGIWLLGKFALHMECFSIWSSPIGGGSIPHRPKGIRAQAAFSVSAPCSLPAHSPRQEKEMVFFVPPFPFFLPWQ